MLSRLLPAFVLMAPMAFGQGIFGTPTGHPRAGDASPDLVFQEVLSAPAAGSSSSPNLSGQVTVLSFFPDTSHNPKPVADWNARVDEYAQRHVQFVWITGEDKRTLMPALARHPIKGWVLYDPGGATAKAFGLDTPVNVYVGPDRKIVGFQQGYIPDEATLNAVLEGRIVLERPTPATITTFRENNLVALDSAPARMPRAEDYRPHLTPSHTVHITPSTASQRGNFGSDDYWVLQGVTLKEAIEELYDVSSIRSELPATVNTAKRYDFAALLPHPESRAAMKERFKQALLEHFHLSVSHEGRLTNVYVVSLEPGRRPPVERTSEFGSRSSSVGLSVAGGWGQSVEELKPESLEALYSIGERGTMDELCRDLEGSLDRPVVNETNLEGRYRIEVQLPADPKASFLTMLRERTGLVIRPGQRRITFLKFKADER
ncbi:MAG TPA: TIGR03435 family protein [Acidobacteriaceae bacterium]|nr:TIGR03435 family protein [Acidobacteriaceae bacterium]